MPDPIDPAAIPGDNLRPDMVDIAAGEMQTIGDEVSSQGSVVVTTWQRLAQHYEAPEAGTLFGVMDPVKTNAETFGNNVDRVSSALKAYAAEVEPIKAELAKIKADAQAFVASIAGGVEKTTYSRAGAMTTTVEWHEDQDSVEANNDLIRRVNAQMVLLWAAERRCANAIYDIIGFPHIEAASDSNPNGYGATEIPDGAETPWGKTVERTESCGEKAAGAVGHFVWNGVVVGGIWGTVKGLGTLTLGYNPQTGEWFNGDAYGAAWSNLGKLAVGLAVTSLPGTIMVQTMPGPAGNFLRDCQMTVVNAGKGLVAWDKWKDDPAAAAGEATFNIASIIIPAGAATAPVRTSASTAAAAIRTAAKIIDVVDPTSALIKVGTAGAKIAMPAIADLVKSIDLSKIGIDHFGSGGKIEIPDLPNVEEPKVEIPAVAKGDMTLDTPHAGATVDVPVRTGDAAVPDPVREPALVGSGDHEGAGHEWDPGQGDPVLSDADHGPGFTRPDDIRGMPIDPNYGQPVAHHGTLGDQYLRPPLSDVPDVVRKLVTDPEAPFGRDAAGHPYSRDDWETRYVDDANRLRFPGNDGAVPERRLDFSSPAEFQAHYGDVLDRLGDENGRYLSLPGTTFEERALPPGSLRQPYLTMRLSDELPPNTVIEVSETAPGFGQPGGGLQIRILDAHGQALSITQLRKQGIIEVIGDTRWPADWPRPPAGTTPHYQGWNSSPSE
jgi:hypothetical protein